MADKVDGYDPEVWETGYLPVPDKTWDELSPSVRATALAYEACFVDRELSVLAAVREDQLKSVYALHADIIDQGRKVQIAASGESKYGAMSDSEFIEWMLGKLEGKCQVLS